MPYTDEIAGEKVLHCKNGCFNQHTITLVTCKMKIILFPSITINLIVR